MCHAFVVVVDAHYIDVPVMNGLKARLFLIDFRSHLLCKVACDAVHKQDCVPILLAQYQNIVSIPHMNSDFQVRTLKVTHLVRGVMEFYCRFIMSAFALIAKPDIKAVQVHIRY